MPKYFIGIDNGSQSTKVAIFDEQGQIAAEGRQPLRPNDTPRPGVVEHPDDDLWDSIGAASKRALSAFVGDPADIAGVGLCTIRFCRAMLRADGTLAHPVLSWMDARVSRPYVDDDPEVAHVTTSSGYISARMTGVFADTAANYQGMWPMDTDTWQWLEPGESFDACGYPREKLFDLVMPGQLIGSVTPGAAAHTGIPVGVPVYATSNDKAVEALGCGLRDPGDVLVSLGTYIAGMAVGRANLSGVAHFWSNFGCQPYQYLYESNGIRRGMWTVSWIRELLGREITEAAAARGVSPEDYLNSEAAAVPCGSDGLVAVLDWLAPTDAPHRKGAFVGFDGRQGRLHMYRAVLESIAMTMANKVELMAAELGTTFERVIVSGGGSNSDLMMAIMADCFGLPAVRMELNNAASLGAAICAAVGSGRYPGFDAAIDAMVRPATTFEPTAVNHETYAALRPALPVLADDLDRTNRLLYTVAG